jgi:hypothetical protein
LGAGKSTSQRVGFRNVSFTLTGAEPARSVPELPPGRYRLTITVLLDSPVPPGPKIPKPPRIQANPVEFEIVAKR